MLVEFNLTRIMKMKTPEFINQQKFSGKCRLKKKIVFMVSVDVKLTYISKICINGFSWYTVYVLWWLSFVSVLFCDDY